MIALRVADIKMQFEISCIENMGNAKKEEKAK